MPLPLSSVAVQVIVPPTAEPFEWTGSFAVHGSSTTTSLVVTGDATGKLGKTREQIGEAFDEAAERDLQHAREQGMAPTLAGPDQVLEGMQLERIMQQGIASLDEDHRVLIVLRDVEELSYEEICQITGLPEGTVKSRLHRARLALKEFLAKHMK